MRPSCLRCFPPPPPPTLAATKAPRRILVRRPPSHWSSTTTILQAHDRPPSSSSSSFLRSHLIPRPSSSHSFARESSAPRKHTPTVRRPSPPEILRSLADRLDFFFSDVNLRHDSYARSILERHQNKYLPAEVLLSFRSVRRYTDRVSELVEAIEAASMSLEAVVDERGRWIIGRTVPFHYDESMRRHRHKIMTVEGWPVETNTQWVESRLRSLLCFCNPQRITIHSGNDGFDANGRGDAPVVAYWNKNVPTGIITLEFSTDEDARRAWDNLHSHAVKQDGIETVHPSTLVVRSLNPNAERGKRYSLHIGGLSLIVRGMDEQQLEASGVRSDEKILSTLAISSHDDDIPQSIPAKDDPIVDSDAADSKSSPIDKWWLDETASPTLSQCTRAMEELFRTHATSPPPPREWLHEHRFKKRGGGKPHASVPNRDPGRTDVSDDAALIVSRMHNSIDRGVVRALGAGEARAVSDFVRTAVRILSESPPTTTTNGSDRVPTDSYSSRKSPYEACMEAFDILRRLNLDAQPHHCSYAVRCACHEKRWEEAADLFSSQIRGDASRENVAAGGFVPVDPTLGWDGPLEVGLYAVAVDAGLKARKSSYSVDDEGVGDDEGAKWMSPSKKVFDAAMKMSMISPAGQESYVLAAGSALGRAGLWSDCLDFATDPSNLSKFGPSIAAAAMLACIESARSAEAIDVYNYFSKSENQNTASEWQWAGGTVSAAKPLLDDLLLRSMGGVSGGGCSGAAIAKFCDIIDDDVPFSGDALIGLMQSMEHDGEWRSAIRLLEAFCDSHFRKRGNKWRLVKGLSGLNGVDIDEADVPTKADLEDLLTNLVASTMRVCNRQGHFGLAMLMCSIANSCVDTKYNFELFWPDDDSFIKTIMSQKLLASKPVLDAYFQSLHRVGLRRIVNKLSKETDGVDTSSTGMQNFSPTAESWIHAFATTNRVLIALNDVQRTKSPLSEEDRGLLSRGIATAMNFCIDANQAASAIHLFAYSNNVLAPKRAPASFRETVMTFFGDTRSEPNTASKIFQSGESFDVETLSHCDSLLSAVIRAYATVGQPDEALAVFENVASQKNYGAPSQDTIQSFNAALEVLLENNPEKFMSLFEDTNSDYLMPSTFLAVARSYARNGAWPEIGEVYNKARRRGCVSEEMGFIAMQAVCEAELVDGKILVLRKIADDISNAIGMKTEEWISSQYWYIKRFAGFHHARLLMNWNTPATSQKEELLFAINEMRRCRSQGVLTKNAPLFCIVKQGELYASSDGSKNAANFTETQRRSAINIIFEACAEAQLSGLIKRPTFTAEVVRSLRALKGDKQCIQFVKTLIANEEEKCPHKIALEYAIRAASEIRDFESLEVLVASFEKSGYDSQSLSL
ncbi:hypothetical protein ACHAWX_006189 [Stephanocyclus meneghinianus]